jgi:hypothetical protein
VGGYNVRSSIAEGSGGACAEGTATAFEAGGSSACTRESMSGVLGVAEESCICIAGYVRSGGDSLARDCTGSEYKVSWKGLVVC